MGVRGLAQKPVHNNSGGYQTARNPRFRVQTETGPTATSGEANVHLNLLPSLVRHDGGLPHVGMFTNTYFGGFRD